MLQHTQNTSPTGSELLRVIGVLKNLEIGIPSPVFIYENNSGAIVLAKKGKFTKRAKHIEVAYHFVPDYVAKGIIAVCKVDSGRQLADILTKPLGSEKFEELRTAISIKYCDLLFVKFNC